MSRAPALCRLAPALLLAALLAAVLVSGTGGGGSATAAVPTVTPVCNGVPNDCVGWRAAPVTLSWQVSAPDADRSGCTTRTFEADGRYSQTCTASFADPATSVSVQVTIEIDRTPPAGVGATLGRSPDSGGWYTSPVQVSFAGSDATSGIASCASVTYAGPDSAAGSVQGGCSDRAGNQSAPVTATVRYDATPPDVGTAAVQPGDGFSVVRWDRTGDDVAVEVTRTPGLGKAKSSVVFRGRASSFVDRRVANGRLYRYDVRAVDQAGNTTSQEIHARPGRRLLGPSRGAHLTAAPVLRWTAVARARYYNVQLRRSGRKVMTAWPARPRLRLTGTWRYAGRRQRLLPGTYRWDVWPGIGRREERRFGPLIGTRTFVVEPAPGA